VGVILLRRLEARLFSSHPDRFAANLADQAVIAIDNANLFEQMQKLARKAEAGLNESKEPFLAMMSQNSHADECDYRMSGLLMDTPLNLDQRDYAETIRTSGRCPADLITTSWIFPRSKPADGPEEQPFDLRECVRARSICCVCGRPKRGSSCLPDRTRSAAGDHRRCHPPAANPISLLSMRSSSQRPESGAFSQPVAR